MSSEGIYPLACVLNKFVGVFPEIGDANFQNAYVLSFKECV